MTERTKSLADLDPLPRLPREAAKAGLDAWLLAIGCGPSLETDPHRVLKMNTFDRLLFERVPVLCEGGTALRVMHTWEMKGVVIMEAGGVL